MRNSTLLLKWFILPVLVLSLALAGCDNDDDDDPDSNNNDNNNNEETEESAPTPTVGPNADAALVSIKLYSVTSVPNVGDVEVETGLATAVFFDNGSTTLLLDAGEVTAEDEMLTRNSNNSYTYVPGQPDMTNPSVTGIDFDNATNWEVAGSGEVDAFSTTHTDNWPQVGDLSAPATIDGSAEFTLSVTNIDDADSVIFHVSGPDGTLLVTKAGNATSHTFTAAEMGSIGTGAGIVQVAPYNYRSKSLVGLQVYLVKETVRSKSVTIE